MNQYNLYGDIFLDSDIKQIIEFDTINWAAINALRKYFEKETRYLTVL